MSDKRLYALRVPRGSLTRASSTAEQQQALQTLLSSDIGSVQSTGTSPTEQPLTVEIADNYAARRAREFAELTTIDEPVPFVTADSDGATSAYVLVSTASPEPVDPRSEAFQRVELQLQEVGTTQTHYRAIQTAVEDLDTDGAWADTDKAPVAVPQTAKKVRWFDPGTKERADPDVVESRTGEFRTVDILDASAAPFEDPELIYEQELEEDAWPDVRVWDDRETISADVETDETQSVAADETQTDDSPFVVAGRFDIQGQHNIQAQDLGRQDGDGALAWQKVFSAGHEFAGNPVLETGRLRIVPDEGSSELRVYRWDDSDEAYVRDRLPTTGWQLYDFDVGRVGLARVDARAEFYDPGQSPTAYYDLDISLERGLDGLLVSRPSGVDDSIPDGLIERLEPAVADWARTASPTKTTRSRSSVRR